MNVNEFYQTLDGLFAQHDTKAIESYLSKSLSSARLDNDPEAIVAVSNELAGFYRAAGKVDEAIHLSQNVLQLLKNMGQETTENFAVALQNGANIMMVAKELDTALQMYQTSESILAYRGLGRDYRMAALQNNISALYREQERFEESELAAMKAIDIISAMPEFRIELATSLINLGEVQTRLGKYTDAKASLELSLQIYEVESGGRDTHYAAANAAMGNLYYFWKQPAAAIPYFKKTLELIERDYGRNQYYEMIERNLKLVEEQV